MSASDRTLTLFNVDLSRLTLREHDELQVLIRKLYDGAEGWVDDDTDPWYLDLSIETSPLTHGEHREFKRLMLKVFAETPWMGGL
ncbi:MAG: hypothetical protein IH626_19420 [Rhodospirillales bacterium]|nr:hypothetical protein [Rhodospirillales bacterium]